MNEDEKPMPKWIDRLTGLVHKNWIYHAECAHINARARYKDSLWEIEYAPIFQELYGGDEDGKKVWAGFIFDVCNFSKEKGVWLENYAVASFCVNCVPVPRIMIHGKYEGHAIAMTVLLEPLPDGDVMEILDTITNKIREVEPQHEGDKSE